MTRPGFQPSSKVQGSDEWTESMEFSQVLGAGSFGVVLKATNKSGAASNTSAVKIIFQEYSVNDPDLKDKEREKILREGNTVLGKRHENIVTTTKFAEKSLSDIDIVKIFEELELDGQANHVVPRAKGKGHVNTFWIEMELCGHNLRSWLNMSKDIYVNNELQKMQVGIFIGLVEGLKYLHENNIMHRDFKPENIFFSHEYSLPVKIGDFGLSRHMHNDNVSNTLTSKVGTLDYMAPEVLSGKYSFQADLFSLGLVLWEVIQLINYRDRRSFFDRFVNDKDQSIIKIHPVFTNCMKVIITLTKRKIRKRMRTIQDPKLTGMTEGLKQWLNTIDDTVPLSAAALTTILIATGVIKT